RDNFYQCFYDLLRRFVIIVRNIGERISHSDTTFPWNIQRVFWNGLFGCYVVLPFSRNGTIYHNDAGLVFTCHFTNLIHIYILLYLDSALPFDTWVYGFERSNPAAI